MQPARFIVFDWDGTAVDGRDLDAARLLIRPLEAVLELGVLAYVVTGTKHDWPAAQLRSLRPELASQVVICCNRGSEVYRLGPTGPSLLHRREMSLEESTALTKLGTAVASPLIDAGHDVEIIADRLNRIKVDLLPDWLDPPKSRIDELVELANARFADNGGLAGLLRATAELIASGPTNLRVTSDAKHIELGITDKADSMDWVLADIASHGGTVADLIIVGDEFGPIGRAEGSDAKTALPGASVYSVGREPNGVPEGIDHLGGGPAQFINILESMVDVRNLAPNQ